MSLITHQPSVKRNTSNFTKSPAQGTAQAATARVTMTSSSLSQQTNPPSSPQASARVTSTQGHTARLVLGSSSGPEQGTGALSLQQKSEAENAVAGNTARKTPVDFGTLQDKESRKAFLKNVTQLDGVDAQGDRDGQCCGPTALVSSITMADPKATQKMAKGILDLSSSQRKKMFKGELSKNQVEALRRINSGKASPADIQVLGQVMADTKGVNVKNGASPDEMAKMISNTTKLLGDDMPDFSLHMYSSRNKSGEAHWQGYANGVEIDPWPDSKGQATLTEGSAGLGQGASRFEGGTVHTKMIVENKGKRITIPRYLGLDAQGNRVHNADVNQPLTTYTYTQDWFGYDYTRSSGDIPSGVDPGQEPSKNFGNAI